MPTDTGRTIAKCSGAKTATRRKHRLRTVGIPQLDHDSRTSCVHRALSSLNLLLADQSVAPQNHKPSNVPPVMVLSRETVEGHHLVAVRPAKPLRDAVYVSVDADASDLLPRHIHHLLRWILQVQNEEEEGKGREEARG